MNQGISLEGRSLMTREEATNLILAAKRTKGVTFAQIAAVVKRHKVWTTATLLGQASMSEEESDLVVDYLGLPTEVRYVARVSN
jgi:cyanate lyase